MRKKISIITPCFNEEANVVECYKRLHEVMTAQLPNYDYEHIFSDNASTDSTVNALRGLASQDFRVKVIVNSRNVGPFRNMWNAMKFATGEAVIPLLPADLQDPPEVIPQFVENWERGDLVVFGVRENRQESFVMRFFRTTYYKLLNKLSTFAMPKHSGEFLLADKQVVKSILTLEDQYPYIRGMFAQATSKISHVPYVWKRRERGKSQNNFLSLIDQAINGLVSTSRAPARLALLLGFLFSFLGICFAGFTVFAILLSSETIPVGIPTVIVGIFLLGGVQLFFVGLLGEYILSIHGQVRPAPPLFAVETLNFDSEQENKA